MGLKWLNSDSLHTLSTQRSHKHTTGRERSNEWQRTPQNTGEMESVKKQQKNRWSETGTGCLHYIQPSLPPGKPTCCALHFGDKSSLGYSNTWYSGEKGRDEMMGLGCIFQHVSDCLHTGLHGVWGQIASATQTCHFLAGQKRMTACL